MNRASKHCLRARITICHEHIKTSRTAIGNTKRELCSLINEDTYATLLLFLKNRATSFNNNTNTRHAKKLATLKSTGYQKSGIDKNNWVVNLSTKPLSPEERSLLEKGPNSLRRPQAFHTRTLCLKSKRLFVTFLIFVKMLLELVLLPSYIEQDCRRTKIFLRKKEKL